MKRSLRAPVFAYFTLLVLFLAPEIGHGQRIAYTIREVTTDVNNPWEMRSGPDGWIYYTERPGRFSKVDPQTREKKILWVADDCVQLHESGALGFDFHPDFPDSPFVFIAYTYAVEDIYRYGIFRFRLEGDTLVERLQIHGPEYASNSHNGSRVIIRDRKIYFSIGDVWSFEIAQDLSNGNGKINRINLDGSIPEDNPFEGSVVWSRGHRNPQGLDFSPAGVLYSSEHGDQTDDEVNIIRQGRNYGWPRIQGFCEADSEQAECDQLDAIEPLAAWTPTIATGDLNYYSSDHIPEWKHSLLLATLKDTSLYHLALDTSGYRVTRSTRYPLIDNDGKPLGRLRSICITGEGRVYIGTGNGSGVDEYPDRIVELLYAGLAPQVVELDYPPQNAAVAVNQVEFHWANTYKEARYQFQISRDPLFSPGSSIYEQILHSDTDLIVTHLEVGESYYWRVRELSTLGPWSEVRTFVTVGAGVNDSEIRSPFNIAVEGGEILVSSVEPVSSVSVEIFDILGREVGSRYIREMRYGPGIPIGRFPAGKYVLRLRSAKSSLSRLIAVP